MLEYLQEHPMELLIRFLIENSQPGTVFFISVQIDTISKKHELSIQTIYIKSHFGTRTDMDF